MRKMKKQIAALCAWLMLFAQIAPVTSTQTQRIWDGGDATSGKWSTAANWSGDTLPLLADTVIFDATSTDPCTSDIADTLHCLIARAGYSGSITLGANLTLNNGDSIANTDSLYMKTYTLDIAGGNHVCKSGKISRGTSTLKYSATSGTQNHTCGSMYYDILKEGAGALTITDSIVTEDDVTISAGDYSQSGKRSRVSGDMLFNGTGTVNLGNSMILAGNNGTYHVASGSGTVTATSCTLSFLGNIQTIDDDKGSTYKTMNISDSTINTSGATIQFSASTPMFVLSENAAFTNNGGLIIFNTGSTGSNTWATFPTTYTYNGTGTIRHVINNNGATYVLPAMVYSGSGNYTFLAISVGGTFSVGGNIDLGNGLCRIACLAASYLMRFNTGNYSFTAETLQVGVANASASFAFNCGSSVFDVKTYNGSVNNTATSGYDSINLGSSTWTVSGSWTHGSNHTIATGTSAITFDSISTITSNGKSFNDIVYNNTAANGTLTLADTLRCDDMTVTDGIVNINGKPIIASGNVAFNATDSVKASAAGSKLTMTGASKTLTTAAAGVYVCDSLDVVWNGSGGTWTNNEDGEYYRTLSLGAGSGLTLGGTTTATYLYGGTCPLTLSNNDHLTNGWDLLYLSPTASCKYITLGSSDTIDGDGAWLLYANKNSVTCTIPEWTYTGTGAIAISVYSGSITGVKNYLAGNVVWGTGNVNLTAINDCEFNGNGYGFSSLGAFRLSPSSGKVLTVNFGDGSYACSTFTYTLTGTSTVSWDTSTWSILDDTLKLRTGDTHIPKSGRVNFTNTGVVPYISLAGDSFPACSLANGGQILGGTPKLARLLINRAGKDSVTFEAAKKVTITQVDSTDWSGPDTSNRNRVASSIDDTASTSRDTLDFTDGNVGFANMRFRNNVFLDTVRCRTGCKSEGGNY